MAYNNLGIVTTRKGTKEAAQEAVTYLETARDMFKGIHHASGLATVENSIVNVKVMCEGWNKENRKEDLNQRQEIYELAVKSYGNDTHLLL